MNASSFMSGYEKASPDIDNEWASKLISKCIEKQGREITVVRCMEEYAELIQVLSKSLRSIENREELLEELADAQLCIFFIQQALGVTGEELCKAMSVKLKHAEDRL